MKNILKYIKKVLIFPIGYVFSIFFHQRKYITGKYFNGRIGGVFSLGWQWVITDCMARIILGVNKGVPFPISPMVSVVNPQEIHFHPDNLNNFQGSGKYFQAINGGKIYIGQGCWIANNVGLITANHDINNLNDHTKGEDIVLEDNCWIGMNSTILPGVKLGPNTIVGAGSVVTKSFPEGNCVIAGNPAKVIRNNNQKI